MAVHDIARALQQYVGHAVVRADRAAVINGLFSSALYSFVTSILQRESEFPRDDFLGEVTFGNEKRHDKNAMGKCSAENGGNRGLDFPKCLKHLGEHTTTAQLIGVLIRWGARLGVHRRAVANKH